MTQLPAHKFVALSKGPTGRAAIPVLAQHRNEEIALLERVQAEAQLPSVLA